MMWTRIDRLNVVLFHYLMSVSILAHTGTPQTWRLKTFTVENFVTILYVGDSFNVMGIVNHSHINQA